MLLEDNDGWCGTAAEYAQPYVLALERDLASRRNWGYIDLAYGFTPFVHVLSHINEHFTGRAIVEYKFCGDSGLCDTHDSHLFWRRVSS